MSIRISAIAGTNKPVASRITINTTCATERVAFWWRARGAGSAQHAVPARLDAMPGAKY